MKMRTFLKARTGDWGKPTRKPRIEPANETLELQPGRVQCSALFSFVAYESVTLGEANQMLMAWGHKMGALNRGNQGAICHALMHEGKPVAVTTASNLIAGVVGNCDWMKRENTIELSRLCAARGGLCRVALRLWREFVFPALGYEYAVSYQDADLHNGNTYRFDGWERVGKSRSGTDTRSGRPGRNKYVWQWPPRKNPNKQCVYAGAVNMQQSEP